MTACVLIATGPREAARRDALAAGFDPRIVLVKSECTQRLGEVRRRAAKLAIRTTVIHSADWGRQPLAQFFELSAARLALPNCVILGEEGRRVASLSWRGLGARVAALPVEVVGGLALAAAESRHFQKVRLAAPDRRPSGGATNGTTVLAIWLGEGPGTVVGGSVTHVSGILRGFRRAGLRVALVSPQHPPPQMQDSIDEFIRVPVMPRRARVTGEITRVAANRFAREAAERALSKLDPAFIYQRFDAFVTCGLELGQRHGIPVVIEWNNSVVWSRNNWLHTRRFKRLFTPLLVGEERYVATRADVLAAVSARAADMALAAGAPAERVLVVPNAVDIEEIDRGRKLGRGQAGRTLVGWVGSFGPWHGAPVLVRAMRELPHHIEAVMVGDGFERNVCEQLARDLGVWDRIEWTGALPHVEAVGKLAGCDVLASPHVPLDGEQAFFGSPTKIFEYMAIGRPIVASRREQIGEVLIDGETACLVPPGDPAALARGIEQVLSEPDRGRRLGEAARTLAEQQHTWDRRAWTILEQLAGRERRGVDPSAVELHRLTATRWSS